MKNEKGITYSFAKEFVCWECPGHCRLTAERKPHECIFRNLEAKWTVVEGAKVIK